MFQVVFLIPSFLGDQRVVNLSLFLYQNAAENVSSYEMGEALLSCFLLVCIIHVIAYLQGFCEDFLILI
jgi:ABC-type spermidine/putrescine transport system permease subunit I